MGGKYFSFLKILDEAKQKEIYVPRKNKSKIIYGELPKKGWPQRKEQGSEFLRKNVFYGKLGFLF